MRHKHYDCIVAWASGNKIEWRYQCFDKDTGMLHFSKWQEITDYTIQPNWREDYEFRIKKEPVIEVKYFQLFIDYYGNISYKEFKPDLENWDLKITYQDGKAIKAELP